MARKCILCGKKYEYCPGCPRDAKKETWYAIYDNENCKNISKALTDYNLNQITKDEAREALSKCDLSIQLDDHYRNEIDVIMAKPKRGMRTKIQIFDEIAAEPVLEEVINEAQAPSEEQFTIKYTIRH